jgi:hypothetical protein
MDSIEIDWKKFSETPDVLAYNDPRKGFGGPDKIEWTNLIDYSQIFNIRKKAIAKGG